MVKKLFRVPESLIAELDKEAKEEADKIGGMVNVTQTHINILTRYFAEKNNKKD